VSILYLQKTCELRGTLKWIIVIVRILRFDDKLDIPPRFWHRKSAPQDVASPLRFSRRKEMQKKEWILWSEHDLHPAAQPALHILILT